MARFPVSPRSAALALAVLVAAAGVARAVDLQGATIVLEVQLPEGEDDFRPPDSETQQLEFMNRANCLCPMERLALQLNLMNPPDAIPSAEVDVWVGTRCDDQDATIRDDNCVRAGGVPDLEDLRAEVVVPIRVRDLIAGTDATCPEEEQSRSAYAIIDENDDGVGEGDYAVSVAIPTDSKPPPLPESIEVTGAEQGILVEWTLPSSRGEDILWFQLLCQRADGTTDEADDLPRDLDPRYLTSLMACDVDDGTRAIPVDGGDPGDDAMARLDPDREFLCGEAGAGSKSIRVGGLENGVAYRIVLIAIDEARNPTAIDLGEAVPQPARDFWEDYKAAGGKAEGGCAAGGAPGLLAAGLVGLALLVRRRRALAAVAALGVALAAGPVRAQPYYEDEVAEEEPSSGAAPEVRWNVDLKFGPYTPAIDDQLDPPGGAEGPFEEMFGDGPFWMSSLTLERFFLRSFGLLGAYGSIGYLATNASAFQVDGDGDPVLNENGKRLRSEGDETGFRLLPLALGATYRLSVLDDRWGIPVVPYGRLGLAYDLWWITSPTGGIAEAPDGDCADPDDPDADCEGDLGRGGSFGWEGTIGLAIRAERLDPDAEAGLRNELGIQHAGLFAELTYADVDGFGSSKKLAVGALHWSFGINFEF
jgi:uncharacterized protein (TIGR03382 family)